MGCTVLSPLPWIAKRSFEVLINSETKSIVFKAINGLAPQTFCRNSQGSLHILRNTSTNLKLPLMKPGKGQNFHSGEQNTRTASQLSPTKS